MKYFVFTGEDFELHPTAEAAKAAATDCIEGWRDNAADGWPDEVSRVCWGKVVEAAVEGNRVERCRDPDCDGECDLSHLTGVDYECDYLLVGVGNE